MGFPYRSNNLKKIQQIQDNNVITQMLMVKFVFQEKEKIQKIFSLFLIIKKNFICEREQKKYLYYLNQI